MEQYQDIPVLPATDPGLNPPPTPYLYLAYTGFSVNGAGMPIIGTTDNSIYYNLNTQLLLGKPGISKNYDKSTVIDFDLRSFTFVCVVQSAESIKGVGANCTLNVSGVVAAGGGKVSKSCQFVQEVGTLSITPVTCSLGSQFTKLSSVAFDTALQVPLVGDAVELTALDNVAAKVRRTC